MSKTTKSTKPQPRHKSAIEKQHNALQESIKRALDLDSPGDVVIAISNNEVETLKRYVYGSELNGHYSTRDRNLSHAVCLRLIAAAVSSHENRLAEYWKEKNS